MKTSRWLILAASSIALLLCLLAVTATGQAGSRIVPEGQTLGVPSDDQGDSVILPEGVSSDWWTQVQKDIQQSEYNVTWQEQTRLSDVAAAYQAPNRAHNLRTYFTPAGVRIIPRDDAPQWELGLTLTGLGYAGATEPVAEPELSADGHRMSYGRGNVSEWYINTEDGLEQGFTIAVRPGDVAGGQTELVLEMSLSGDLVPTLTEEEQAVEFATPDGLGTLRYGELRVTDAEGKQLPSRLCLSDSTLSIAVDDSSAVYPIEIDPMLTTPNWIADVRQVSAYFGSSVSTAGDVNGDGYSDVIVGSPYYDGGQTDEGMIEVFWGVASGPSTSWGKESNQAGARLGRSVDTAGDVNGDGYSDIIAGANLYDNGYPDEGAALVWYGSSSGPVLGSVTLADAGWGAFGQQGSALMGDCVAPAGDVNGDGYSDVIIGARYYDHGQADEGMAFVYYGSSSGLVSGGGTPDNANWSAESNQVSAYMGYSLRTAGDVNGDGYSDVIIAAYYYDNPEANEGRVFIWHGSSTGLVSDNGTPSNANWSAEGNQASAYFGISVSTAGDVNGDGYSDVIIGAHYYDGVQTDEGRAYVWYGSSTGLGSAASPNWTAESNQDNAYFGASVSTAGDVNGDGYADIIVGAPNYDSDLANEGAAFVWYGSSSGLGASGTPSNGDWTTEGNQAGASFGAAVNIAGDVNGDGYSDVVVGAPNYDNPEVDGGRISVYNGAAGDPGATPWTAESNLANAEFGTSVSTAGDVNGDGYSDVIIGAPYFDGGLSDEGRAYVYNGSATGLNSSPAWTADGEQVGAHFGISVGMAGDVNGDGYSDVIVGADYYDDSQTDEGAAFVWYGSASGLGASGTPTNADWTAESDQESARLGLCVGTAGDVNGDGYSDVIVGADRYVLPDNDWGATFVWLGSSSGLGANGTPANADWKAVSDQGTPVFGGSVGTAGDVNGDGYSDVIIGARDYHYLAQSDGAVFVYYGSSTGLGENGTTANADWKAAGNQDFAYLGVSAGSAGDVNGDGYSDIIVGAPGYANGPTDEGGAFVYCGSSSGLVSTGVDPADPADADWSAESNAENARLGSSVSTAGDVNGDGYADVIVGADGYSSGETPEGTAFLWYGSSTGLGSAGTPGNADWSTADDSLFFGSGCSVGMAGDVNGDAYADVIVGAPGYSSGQSSEGGAFVYYGNGGPGKLVLLEQRRTGDGSFICPLGKSDDKDSFLVMVGLYSAFGAGYARPLLEVKPLGELLDGTSVQGNTGLWWPFVTYGSRIMLISDLPPNTPFHWRARLQYPAASSPFQQYSRWVSMPWNGWQEADLRTAPNTPPVAVADSYSTYEDTLLSVAPVDGVLENDSDYDGDSLTAVKVTEPGHGTVTLSSHGGITYTPTANYNGADSFTYRAYDGTDYSNTATVNITVNAVNDAPSFTEGANQGVPEDAGAQTVSNWATTISAGPPDESDQTLNFIVSNDNNGLFSAQPAISASGTLTYTPAANANGSATVTFSLKDNGGTANGGLDTSGTQTFTITVTSVNDAPSFTKGDDKNVPEDSGAQTVPNWATGLSAGPSDETGQTLDFIVTNNNNALFSVQPAISAGGTLTYTPAANANGSATVTVSIHDNGGTANGGVDTSGAQTFTITVTAVNDLPTAADDSYGVHRDRTLNVATPGVLTNDSDVEGPLTAVLVSSASHGTLTLNPDGSFTYTPAADYSGSDSFTYKASDGTAESGTVTVNITVHAVNHAPEAVGDTCTVAEDAALSVPIGTGVLTNDTDADSDPLKALLVANVSHGVLVLNDDGSFAYTPAANFNGTDSFTYKVNDGLADSGVATVTITVSPVNDLPAATADAYNAFVGITLTVPAPGLLANDSDLDGNALTAILVTNVSHGTLTLNADGSFTYTAESGFAGSDSFTYKADDGTGDSATVTVTIEVAVPKPPTITSIEAPSGRRGKVITVTVTGTNLEGATELDFGAGITVNPSFTSSPTQITAEITIDADAVPGTRDVLVKTPEGTYTLEDAFTVKKASSGGTPVWIWPVIVMAVLAAGAGGFFLLRRRNKPG